MPTPPRPSPQADGTPESLHKSQKDQTNRAHDHDHERKERTRTQTEAGDEHLGAKENQVSDTTAPAGPAYKDEPKQG